MRNFRIKSDRIKKMMKENEMTISEFAKGVELSESTARGILVGSIRQPKLATVVKICNCLNCSSDYLLGISNNPHPIG